MTPTTHQPASRPLTSRLGEARHGPATTVVLHLAPGAVFAAAALVLARQAAGWGLPPIFGLLAANAVVLVPVQLGLIALAAKQRTGSWSLRGALGYTRRQDRRTSASTSLAQG
jgi:uncharacterized protein